jgi:hypothetical protein
MLRTFGLAAIAVAAVFCCKSQAATVLTSAGGFTNAFRWHFSSSSEGQQFDAKIPGKSYPNEVRNPLSLLFVNEKSLTSPAFTSKRDATLQDAANESNSFEQVWVSAVVFGYTSLDSDLVVDQEPVQLTQP